MSNRPREKFALVPRPVLLGARRVHLYSDGSCRLNPGGPGTWAFVVVDGREVVHEASGYDPETTSNRMEMMALIRGEEWLLANGFGVQAAFTDSQLVVRCASGAWARKSNLDLWRRYAEVLSVLPQWVPGHAGVLHNERADELCALAYPGRDRARGSGVAPCLAHSQKTRVRIPPSQPPTDYSSRGLRDLFSEV